VDHEHFDPIPIPIIAITLTVVRLLALIPSIDTQQILTMATFLYRSNGALASGLVARDEILTGTMQSSKLYMIRTSRRFSTFRHMALRAFTNCSAVYCGMRGRVSLSYRRRHSLTPG
jgi:hypothetical protein